MDVRVEQIKLGKRSEKEFSLEENLKLVADSKETKVKRNIAALKLAWLQRREQTVNISCLDLGVASILNLPGEAFIEYQLAAQEMRPDLFVCVASYGDGGPGYIPTDKAFAEGGYEPTGAFAPPNEGLLISTISKLLGPKAPQTTIPFKRFKKKNK
jgi:hypothetical protein